MNSESNSPRLPGSIRAPRIGDGALAITNFPPDFNL